MTMRTLTRTALCPLWCRTHIEPDDMDDGVVWGGDRLHVARDYEGETLGDGWSVGVSQSGDAPATVDAQASGVMTPSQARALAQALVEAAALAEASAAAV